MTNGESVNAWDSINRQTKRYDFPQCGGKVKAAFEYQSDWAYGYFGSYGDRFIGNFLVGECTKLSNYIMAQDKVYEAESTFGSATDSDDAEGNTIATVPMPQLELETLETVLASLIGSQEQIPPAFSAISVNGERLYKSTARRKSAGPGANNRNHEDRDFTA